jgi:hypothetical protein
MRYLCAELLFFDALSRGGIHDLALTADFVCDTPRMDPCAKWWWRRDLPQPAGIAYSDADVQAIEDKLNQWTRKRLGFRTPCF